MWPQPVWMVAENWRYEEAFERAAALVHDGAIGQVLTVHFTYFVNMRPGNKYYASTWRRSGQFQGGFLLDGGVHFVAAMRMSPARSPRWRPTARCSRPTCRPPTR